jgi:hypothetical protein
VAQIKEEKSTLEQILGLSSDGILLLDGLDHGGKLVRLEDLLAAASPARPRASSEV